jgi:aspartate/methionine/tyrosine aminotransferase
MDEFYGGYNYTSNCDGTTISAAENVEDVDEDDVLIIDGLTKRFRLPGWRIAWIIGPKVCQSSVHEHRHLLFDRNSLKRSDRVDPTLMVAPMYHSKRPPFLCSSQIECSKK